MSDIIKGKPVVKKSTGKRSSNACFVSVGRSMSYMNVSGALCALLNLEHNDIVGFLEEDGKWFVFKADNSDVTKEYGYVFKQYKNCLSRIHSAPIARKLIEKINGFPSGHNTVRFYVSSHPNHIAYGKKKYIGYYVFTVPMPTVV